MKKLLIKLLEKIVGQELLAKRFDIKKMQNWLFDSYEEEGFKNYYTMRKKFITNELENGMEGKEYWKRIGKLEELRALSASIIAEVNRRKKK